MTRIVVTGYKGNIGQRLIKIGYEPLECDVTSEVSVSLAISKAMPDLIIHLASKSNVNFCHQAKNQEIVMQTNSRGSSNVFKYAEMYGAKVVCISSDYVFGGMGFGNYTEKAKLSPTPKNFYGVSKIHVEAFAEAYDNVNIIRTSTLFWKNRPLIACLMDDVAKGKDVYAPAFMWRSFMHVDHFVKQLTDYCIRIDTMPKVLNLSGSRVVSWYTFAKEYAKAMGLDDRKVHPKFKDEAGGELAPRPYRCGLSTKLSTLLNFTQYNYMNGIIHDLTNDL